MVAFKHTLIALAIVASAWGVMTMPTTLVQRDSSIQHRGLADRALDDRALDWKSIAAHSAGGGVGFGLSFIAFFCWLMDHYERQDQQQHRNSEHHPRDRTLGTKRDALDYFVKSFQSFILSIPLGGIAGVMAEVIVHDQQHSASEHQP
ncbi:hypothetical protein OC846_005973 [Tilletia horrida]|uniref:Uncharacterized protein n=1 Tax=Tilletia horrida TaxID=155126 RepID=A0AAN6JP17_9BASI|nr:hypothetical protein OC846_005973 [Tilletia horrida]